MVGYGGQDVSVDNVHAIAGELRALGENVPYELTVLREGEELAITCEKVATEVIERHVFTIEETLTPDQAAFREALRYARERSVFGRPLFGYPLTKATLGRMAAKIQASRRLTYRAAAGLDSPAGPSLAAMAKALASRSAEEVSRDAMQIHGGYGYAEEYPVSRLFVDARVLSIFEGTEEILALRVIARDLLNRAGGG